MFVGIVGVVVCGGFGKICYVGGFDVLVWNLGWGNLELVGIIGFGLGCYVWECVVFFVLKW